jgi:hypothetical protein
MRERSPFVTIVDTKTGLVTQSFRTFDPLIAMTQVAIVKTRRPIRGNPILTWHSLFGASA